jgi:HAD superfamily hydrolase (TIGR01484 family)
MKYKALFLDVDGTTVVHGINSIPTTRVTEAIAACARKGVTVCLATSRPLRTALPVIEHLSLTGYCVISSGSQIYDPLQKTMIKEHLFPRDAIDTILTLANEHHAVVKVYDGIRDLTVGETRIPPKVMGMYFPELTADQLQTFTKALSGIKGISLHRMEAWNATFECLDIVSEHASKLHGVVDVAKLMHLSTHEIIGVGDGYNDFPLLMACGLKIAMGNAVPELKAIADFVAPTVDEDGVATVIEKFILTG